GGGLGQGVEVVDQRGQRDGGRDLGGVGPDVAPHLARRRASRLGPDGALLVVKGLVQEGRPEVHADGAAGGGDGLEHGVGHVAGMLVSARDDECEARTGLALARTASQNVGAETCETSTITPRRFISFTTSRPKGVSPLTSPASFAEPPISLLVDQVSVM